MSRSYWLSIIALGLVLTAAFTAWGTWQFSKYQFQHANERQSVTNYEAPTGGNHADSCLEKDSGLAGIAKCLIESIDANREAQRSQYDLQAQQEMAEWAFALVLLTFAQAVASGFGIVLLVQNLGIAREANNVAREVGRDQTRAYVYVERVEYTANPAGILVAWIKNGGQTPAKDVQSSIFVGVTSETKKSTNRPKNLVPFRWGLIGPGDSIPVTVYQKNLGEILKEYVEAGDGRSLIVIGTVEYDTIYGEEFKTDAIFSTSALFDATKPFGLDISIQGGTEAFVRRPKSKTK